MRTIQELRKQRNLTAFQLDEAAGVGKGFTTRVECGLTIPDRIPIGQAHKICLILGISLDEFYNIVKSVEPNHKKGSPLMVKGQPQSWRKKKND